MSAAGSQRTYGRSAWHFSPHNKCLALLLMLMLGSLAQLESKSGLALGCSLTGLVAGAPGGEANTETLRPDAAAWGHEFHGSCAAGAMQRSSRLAQQRGADKFGGYARQRPICCDESGLQLPRQRQVCAVVERQSGRKREVDGVFQQGFRWSDGFQAQIPEGMHDRFHFSFRDSALEAQDIGNLVQGQVGDGNCEFPFKVLAFKVCGGWRSRLLDEPLQQDRCVQEDRKSVV